MSDAEQTEQTEQASLRLGSLGEETPAVEPAGFPDLGPDLGAGSALEGPCPGPRAPSRGRVKVVPRL